MVVTILIYALIRGKPTHVKLVDKVGEQLNVTCYSVIYLLYTASSSLFSYFLAKFFWKCVEKCSILWIRSAAVLESLLLAEAVIPDVTPMLRHADVTSHVTES